MQPASSPFFLWLVLIVSAAMLVFIDDERRFQISEYAKRNGVPLHVMFVSLIFFLVVVTSPGLACVQLPRVLFSR